MIVVIFAFPNAEVIRLKFLGGRLEVPPALLILVMPSIGFLLGWAAAGWSPGWLSGA